MHVSLDSALGRQRRLNSVGESVLQIAPSAAAAYSLRSLTGGDPEVVNVRRSSDNVEKKFTASGISSGALLDFVKTEAVTYTSDFSTDTDGWSVNNGALAVSGGALEMTPNSVSITHHTSKSGQVAAGTKARISFDVKIPSGQSLVTGFKFVEISGTTIKQVNNQTQGDFVSYSEEFTSTNAGILRFFASNNGSLSFAGDDSEKLIIKNIVVTSIDENGFVDTWYDQSGNSNNAEQPTAGSQPTIVENGNFLDELKFDGTDDNFELTSVLGITSVGAIFSVAESGGGTDNIIIDNRDASGDGLRLFRGGSQLKLNWKAVTRANGSLSSNTKFIGFGGHSGSSVTVGVNGGDAATSDSNTISVISKAHIGARSFSSATSFWDGTMNELIVYDTDQTDNRDSVQVNLSNYYNITLV